jgi:hypothetical protein
MMAMTTRSSTSVKAEFALGRRRFISQKCNLKRIKVKVFRGAADAGGRPQELVPARQDRVAGDFKEKSARRRFNVKTVQPYMAGQGCLFSNSLPVWLRANHIVFCR